jgi:hypothetical protein
LAECACHLALTLGISLIHVSSEAVNMVSNSNSSDYFWDELFSRSGSVEESKELGEGIAALAVPGGDQRGAAHRVEGAWFGAGAAPDLAGNDQRTERSLGLIVGWRHGGVGDEGEQLVQMGDDALTLLTFKWRTCYNLEALKQEIVIRMGRRGAATL